MSKHLLLLPLASTLLCSCANRVPTHKDMAFTYAVEAVQDESYVKGARAAYNFVGSADQDDPRYDRGLRLLASSAEGLELNWAAALMYRQISQVRRNLELVPDALRGLERIVNSGVYDEDTIVTAFLASEEFGDLPRDLQAFVDYQYGLDLARRGDDEWAAERFKRIPETSPYAQSALYVDAVRLVANGQYAEAVAALEEIKKSKNLEPRLSTEVERSLARIAFEEKRYDDALSHFEALREMAPDDPEILLETAWTYYYLGDSRKTLGLLVSLDAPVHHSYITPERYLLEALALRRICQFEAAREAAVNLERRYVKTLNALSDGDLPRDIPPLRAAARQRGLSRDNWKLIVSLRREMATVDDLSRKLGPKLTTYLEDIYKRALAEAQRREDERIDREADLLAEELLAAREGVRLIIHELGVSILRGRRRPEGALEKPKVDIPVTGERVFYPFGGEYWTDELDDFVVVAEDRCIE